MTLVKAGAKIQFEEQKTSRFVESQLPAFLVNMESMIVPFLKAYYEWMEQKGGITYDIRSILDMQDIDKTTEEFMSFFMDEFLPGIPASVLADKALLVKHAKEFYSSKGSENSFKFLFRILYNEDLEFYYPKQDLFRSSDAVWIVDKILKVSAFDVGINNLNGRRIYGTESGASAIVETTIFGISGSTPYASMILTEINGTFVIDEAIETRDENQRVFMRCLGQVGSVSIDSQGTGYLVGHVVSITDKGDGDNFFAYVSAVGVNGELKKIDIIDSGVGYYEIPPTTTLAGMTGTGASISFTLTAMRTAEGRFADDSCMPSSTKRLQDGKMYQEYSYVLKSGVTLRTFKDTILRLLHPAGFFMGSIMRTLANGGFPIPVGVFNHHDVNFDDPDHPSNRLFIDVILHREYFHGPQWTIGQIDERYPNGIPLGATMERIFNPELLIPLPKAILREVRIESRIQLNPESGGYGSFGYTFPGYWRIGSYPQIVTEIIDYTDNLLIESGDVLLLEDGSQLLLD